MTKADKESLYYEHRGYIRLIVSYFMSKNKTYLFMHDDLLQDAAEKFLLICDKYDPEREVKFTTFLYDQLQYYLRNALIKEVQTQVAEETYSDIKLAEDDAYDPNRFEEILHWVPITENQREVLRLRYVVGLTYQEIADEFNISKQSVKRTEDRALKMLRTNLE
jgi:RNA polymerase sigma factor (sigma-70 family)